MFCPTCGAFAPPRVGDGKSYYKRIDSRENEKWLEWQEQKPRPKELFPRNVRKDWDYYENSSTYDEDMAEWEAKNNNIMRYTQTARGRQLEVKGEGYINCNKCPYHGPVNSATIVGKNNLEDFNTTTEAIDQDYEIYSGRSERSVNTGNYLCPKCPSDKVYIESPGLEFGAVRVTFLECSACNHKWKE